jgi:hypothetical protein
MFRAARPFVSLLAAGLLLLGACGGDDSGSSSNSGSGSGDGAAEAALAELVTAIEGLGYTCKPESFVMTGAIREICTNSRSMVVSAYAWADIESFATQVGSEVRCAVDNLAGAEEVRFLQGSSWAISAISPMGGKTPSEVSAIDGVLQQLQVELGGELVVTPCA